MTDSIKNIIAGVRDYVGNPDYGRLSNPSVLNRLNDKFDLYRAQLNLSKTNLTFGSGSDETVVNAPAWGRPVLVATKDDSDPNHQSIEIPIVTVQDRDLYYQGSKTGVSGSVSPHVATSIAFFKSNGQVRAKCTPQHSQSATYELWYQPDRPTPPRLADNYPLLEAFQNLIKVDTALSCLPKLMILKDGVATNAAELAFYERRLQSDKADYLHTFNQYKNQSHMEQAGMRGAGGWGDDEIMGGWGY
jgi:hypothetical protein